MAAPSFRSETHNDAATSTTCTINKPTGVVADDILVALVYYEHATAAVTPPAGWTLIRDSLQTGPSSFDYRLIAYWKRAGGSEPASYDWTLATSSYHEGAMVAVQGCVASGSPVDVEGATVGSKNAAPVTPTVTTTGADRLLVCIYTSADGGAAIWAPGSSGMTERVDSVSKAFYDVAQASAGATGTKTVSCTGGINPEFHVGQIVALIPTGSTARKARVSWGEVQVPLGPRKARLSWAEAEMPGGPRRARASWAEVQVPTAPRRGRLSWAEVEAPLAPRRARVSFAELEAPLAPRRARFSWAEAQTPLGPRRARLSWSELEAPIAIRRARVSWFETQFPLPPRRARLSVAELEVPNLGQRAARLSWVEVEVPLSPRKARFSWSELQVPLSPRRARLSWTELEAPLGARRARLSQAEMEVPTGPRKGRLSWFEGQFPLAPRRARLSWVELETPPGPRRARVSMVELELPTAPTSTAYKIEYILPMLGTEAIRAMFHLTSYPVIFTCTDTGYQYVRKANSSAWTQLL